MMHQTLAALEETYGMVPADERREGDSSRNYDTTLSKSIDFFPFPKKKREISP
jgi:hypothetical protein